MPKTHNRKDTVSVRERKLKDGRLSLYLDIYTGGKRSYEPLHIYLTNTRSSKSEDRDKRGIADAIANERLVQIRKGEFDYFANKDVTFLDYYNKFISNKTSGGNNTYYNSILNHLKDYANLDTTPLAALNLEWFNGLRDHLIHKAQKKGQNASEALSRGTVKLYLICIRSFIASAVNDGLLNHSCLKFKIDLEAHQKERQYLTIEELQILSQTPYPHKNDTACRMFLFSCLTGLRRSDVLSLKWGMLHKQGEFTRIVINQQKTGGLEYIDLTPQAVEVMGTPGKADDYVFGGLTTVTIGNHITQWIKASGIKKHITFHCARHTFATLMLYLDTDLYTVSKLLGHRDIKTTQIYAKIVDKKKQAAIMRIPTLPLTTVKKKNKI